jgi:DNA-binding XRE family transcriptional regulator
MIGFVYAVGDQTGRVKIGWSGDPLRRLNKIGSDCSSAVTLLGLIPATRAQEAEIQVLLNPWKVNREWFYLKGPVKAFVDKLPQSKPHSVDSQGIHPLRKWRLENKKTRDDLAAAVGVSGVTITRWENGARRIPDGKLPVVSAKTGIPRTKLRPDLAALMREAAE